MKSAFVTGATGFVGLNLVEELVRQGWQVTALHRVESDLAELGRFPVTLYKEQWTKLLAMADEIRAFIKDHDAELKAKPEG